MTHYDIIKKLIGSVEPSGDSGIDKQRLDNLTDMHVLVEQLIRDIKSAASCSDRQEHSMRQIGLQAKIFLQEIAKDISQIDNKQRPTCIHEWKPIWGDDNALTSVKHYCLKCGQIMF